MKRFIDLKRVTFMALALAMLLVFAAPQADAAYHVKKIWARFSATAGETLATGEVVCIKDADGYAYQADANDAALRPAVGIVGKGGSSGDTVEIVVVGKFSGWSSLSEGAAAYLSETAAAVTQSAPSWNQQLGVAISTTEYFFNLSSYLDSSSVTSIGTLSGASPIILEGATADDYETTISVTDPTADNTVTLADGGGTVMLSALATNAADAANSVWGISNGIKVEGATADAYEGTLTWEDPTTDNTWTLPDYTGAIPMVIGQSSTQTSQAGSGTADVTGSSLSIAAGWLTAGKTIRWTLAGTLTGGNNAASVHLYLSDATVITLTFPAATAGDWKAVIILHEHTDADNQDVIGWVVTAAGAGGKMDYAAATKDVSGAVTAKAQIQSANAGDTITCEYVLIETWTK